MTAHLLLAVGATLTTTLVVAVLVSARSSEDRPAVESYSQPAPTLSDVTTSPELANARVVTSRKTNQRGRIIKVRERSTLVSGKETAVTPSAAVPIGLQVLDVEVSLGDEPPRPLTSSAQLTAGQALRVIGRYRLSGCPDVIPAHWPSPVTFPSATRTFRRVDEPLHTAAALCPQAANNVPDSKLLDARLGQLHGPVSVQLRWRGSDPQTVTAIGSASAMAAVSSTRACGGTCLAELPPSRWTTVSLQAVDPCGVGSGTNRLTLVVQERTQSKPLATTVAGLGRALCQ